MYSKKKVTELFEREKKDFDACIFLRPDVLYLQNINVKYIYYSIKHNILYCPNFHMLKNFNDRFAITNIKNGLIYGKLFDDLYLYSQYLTLHSETFHSNILRKKYKIKIINIPFYFSRIRANGKIDWRDKKLIIKV